MPFLLVLVGVIFPQVNAGVPQQVADLIPWYQITVQLQGTQSFLLIFGL